MPDINSSISELTLRMLKAVENLSEQEKKEFLMLIGEQRRFSRKSYLTEVSYKTKNQNFNDFILDISPGGTFIETENNFFTGQELYLKIKFSDLKPFEIKGCVVWHSSNGIGVRFIFETIEQQQELIKLINEI
ncbi:MAG: PilZ domain-containing protein [Desulforegulaceae bacterium]|jgi:Tfp pilus assembly protein PilZ|nr:PilZ domain-containing protein [Desulforegulaceae bacterium]